MRRGMGMVEWTIQGRPPDKNLRGAWEVLAMLLERQGWTDLRLVSVRELAQEQMKIGGMRP